VTDNCTIIGIVGPVGLSVSTDLSIGTDLFFGTDLSLVGGLSSFTGRMNCSIWACSCRLAPDSTSCSLDNIDLSGPLIRRRASRRDPTSIDAWNSVLEDELERGRNPHLSLFVLAHQVDQEDLGL
jgi:hypothetical protein